MIILLGSKNLAKTNAVDKALIKLGIEEYEIIPVAVESNTNSKPVGYEIIRGAENRNIGLKEYALENKIGYFVIDSLEEIELIDKYASDVVDVVLRVNPGVEAHTHEFIQTGQEDSKFGLSIKHGLADKAIQNINSSKRLNLKGIHFHIGSQIEGTDAMIETSNIVIQWLKGLNLEVDLLNIGGGFGIHYVEGDVSFPIETGIKEITDALKDIAEKNNYPLPTIGIEPGRSIVGEAGVTLYEVGTIKEIPGVNKYVSIDGGMSDHIRTALYGAKYDALLVNREEPANDTVTISGKLCESGDIIARDVKLPESVHRGDYLAILSTGAYHYSMASNYNQMQKPSVFFIKDGKAREVIKRQSLRQLIINDTK